MLVKQSERVKDYMNYMITYEMEEYDPELDHAFVLSSCIGSHLRKVYFDPPFKGRASVSLFMLKMIVPYGATDLLFAAITHRITMDSNEVRKLQLMVFIVTLTCLLLSTESDTAAMGAKLKIN